MKTNFFEGNRTTGKAAFKSRFEKGENKMKALSSAMLAILLVSGFGFQPRVFAEAVPANLEARLASLEKEVAILRRLNEVNREVQYKKDTETPMVVAGKDGFALKSRDGDFTLKFKGQVQADGRYYGNDNTSSGNNQYLIRRLRPSIEGTVFRHFDFRLLTDFSGSAAAVQDAWIDFKYWKAASLRAGKFKSPVGLERLQGDPNKVFIEDSLTSNLIPNRDIGFDLHGELLDGRLNYDLGVGNGVTDGGSADTDVHDDKDFFARIFSFPFKKSSSDWITGIGIGVGASIGRAHGTTSSSQLPSFRSGGQQTFFSYGSGVFADGEHNRIVPQASYYKGPLGVIAEWAISSQRARLGSREAVLKNHAWQIAGSYVLTGEDASYNGVIPRRNFDIKDRTWGAWEVAARLHSFKVDKDAVEVGLANPLTAAKGATAWTLGLNWYLNKYLKFMTDFEQTFFSGGKASGGNRRNENAFLSRIQMAF